LNFSVPIWASVVGGGLIGLSAAMLMLFHGRIAGISGITVRALPPYLDGDAPGRLSFLLGLVLAPLAISMFFPLVAPVFEGGLLRYVIAGAFVGFGTILGNGCTSGHGVCGLARLSPRSMVAVGVFTATAALVVYLERHTW
jgi:uncharacterized protein